MSERSTLQRFLGELRRRHVPQTAAVYLVAAWAAIEFSDVVVPNLDGPQWVVQAVIVAAGVGLPVVLVLAWMFDWGPDGIQRTGPESEVARETSTPTGPSTSSPWLAAVAVLAVAIGSAIGVAALLSGTDGDEAIEGVVREGGAAPRSGDRRGGEAPDAPAPPPALSPLDSAVAEIERLVGGGEGLSGLSRLERLSELGAWGVFDDSEAAEEMRELALELAEESDLAVWVRTPRQWRIGLEVPVALGQGDTLVVDGVAQDSAGVVAVVVDGEQVAESEDPQPYLPFRARVVGTAEPGIRRVPIVVRTADGRELETVYSVAQRPPGRP